MIREVLADGSIDRGGAFQSIPRPRVQARLAEACAERVALIVAPAGYGKSVALNAYLQALRSAYVRYDVDESGANLSGFVRGFVAAIAEVAPTAVLTIADALKSVLDAKAAGTDLAFWMYTHLKGYGGTIVIDDFHKAGADSEVSRFITTLIDKTKSRIAWLVSTRSTLDLPVASWLAYGASGMAVDEHDLSFDIDEVRASARALRLAVRDDELSALLGLTNGWPTAIIFALRSSTRSNDLKNMAATTREMIYRYLAEQVYVAMTDETQEFLRDAALLPRLDVKVLQYMGHDRAEAILEELRHTVAFISVDSVGYYRIHDLFRDFLDYESRMLGAARLSARFKRVANALERLGRFEEALLLYRRAEDWENSLRIIELAGFDILKHGGSEALESAVSAIPHALRSQSPIIIGLRATFQADRRRFTEAERLYRKALFFPIDARMRARFSLALNALLVANGRTDAIGLLEDRTLIDHPDSEIRVDVGGALAMSYGLARRPAEAETMIQKCLDLIDDVDDDRRALTLGRLSIACFYLPDYDRVEQFATEGAALAGELGSFGVASRCFSSLYAVSSMRGDSTQALWFAQQMAAAATRSADRFAHYRALTSILDIESQRGNVERVESTLRTIVDLFGRESLNDPFKVLEVVALQAAWNGSFDRAILCLGNSLKGITDESQIAFRRSLIAMFLAALGQRDQALESLVLVADFLSRIGPAIDRFSEFAGCFSAIANVLLGRTTIAKKALRASPPLGEPAGLLWRIALLFADSPLTVNAFERESHLRSLSEAGFGGYTAVIRMLPCYSTDIEGESELLTPTESAVLTLLDRGLRPKAIAESTGRSVHTVQNHIRSVISKLGTSGRDEALVVARRRGMIPEKPSSQI